MLYITPVTPPVRVCVTTVPEMLAAPLITLAGLVSTPLNTVQVHVADEIVSPIASREVKSKGSLIVSPEYLAGKLTRLDMTQALVEMFHLPHQD